MDGYIMTMEYVLKLSFLTWDLQYIYHGVYIYSLLGMPERYYHTSYDIKARNFRIAAAFCDDL